MTGSPKLIRSATPLDEAWIDEKTRGIGGPVVVSGGVLRDLRTYPALVALRDDGLAGLAVWRLDGTAAELLAIGRACGLGHGFRSACRAGAASGREADLAKYDQRQSHGHSLSTRSADFV